MFTNRFFWPVYGALVLMLASCADGGKYVNALPEDAAAVVAVNLEQMAGKSGADKSTVEAAVGALKSEMRGAEGLIDRIVEDPSESGFDRQGVFLRFPTRRDDRYVGACVERKQDGSADGGLTGAADL